MLLLELADDSDHHLVPVDLRQKIVIAAGSLHEHDKTAANFVKKKKYESRWGYTLFGRCLGADTPESSVAQKTKFGWMRYPQAAQRTAVCATSSSRFSRTAHPPITSPLPTKSPLLIKGQYKRIADQVRDDPILCGLSIPLPKHQ